MNAMRTHVLIRMNPKGPGIDFIGRCALCGEENLPAEATALECGNPGRVPVADAIMIAVEGEPNK